MKTAEPVKKFSGTQATLNFSIGEVLDAESDGNNNFFGNSKILPFYGLAPSCTYEISNLSHRLWFIVGVNSGVFSMHAILG